MELLTERLVLREFVADDWAAVLAYQRDARYLRLYEWTERSAEDVRAFVGLFVAQQQEQPRARFQLAVTLRDGDRRDGDRRGRAPALFLAILIPVHSSLLACTTTLTMQSALGGGGQPRPERLKPLQRERNRASNSIRPHSRVLPMASAGRAM